MNKPLRGTEFRKVAIVGSNTTYVGVISYFDRRPVPLRKYE